MLTTIPAVPAASPRPRSRARRAGRVATRVGAVALVVAVPLVLGGCSEQLGDRESTEGVTITDLDSVQVYRNIDNFPNIARVCADGVAFATSSSADVAPAMVRVPEWDDSCPSS